MIEKKSWFMSSTGRGIDPDVASDEPSHIHIARPSRLLRQDNYADVHPTLASARATRRRTTAGSESTSWTVAARFATTPSNARTHSPGGILGLASGHREPALERAEV